MCYTAIMLKFLDVIYKCGNRALLEVSLCKRVSTDRWIPPKQQCKRRIFLNSSSTRLGPAQMVNVDSVVIFRKMLWEWGHSDGNLLLEHRSCGCQLLCQPPKKILFQHEGESWSQQCLGLVGKSSEYSGHCSRRSIIDRGYQKLLSLLKDIIRYVGYNRANHYYYVSSTAFKRPNPYSFMLQTPCTAARFHSIIKPTTSTAPPTIHLKSFGFRDISPQLFTKPQQVLL
jgi:hypothetical protein